LIGQVASSAWELVHDIVGDDGEVEGSLVDVEAFVVEGHARRRHSSALGCAGGI
jgi:hypothetical protein